MMSTTRSVPGQSDSLAFWGRRWMRSRLDLLAVAVGLGLLPRRNLVDAALLGGRDGRLIDGGLFDILVVFIFLLFLLLLLFNGGVGLFNSEIMHI